MCSNLDKELNEYEENEEIDEENVEESDDEKDNSFNFTLNIMHDNSHALHVYINDDTINASIVPNSKNDY